jgi:hypothetical protein
MLVNLAEFGAKWHAQWQRAREGAPRALAALAGHPHAGYSAP